MKNKLLKLKVYFGGFAVGVINGLLGAGGGMIAVPLLTATGLERKEAHANSVAVIMPLSIFTATLYILAKNVEIAQVLPFLPQGLIGAAVGTFLLGKIPNKWLKLIFSGFMVWAGFRLLLR